MVDKRDWKQSDVELEKYGDVRSAPDRYKPRHLTPTPKATPEILAQREAQEQFRIKRTK